MSDLFYSSEAEDVMNLFYQVDYMLYVEGPDDVCFWEIIFQKVSNISVQVQDVGGSNELKPYIERIMNNELDAIIACDSDFTKFDDSNIVHPRIVRTYGYSIENTFVNERTIHKVVKNLGRFNAKNAAVYDFKKWFDNANEKTQRLVLLDIFNYLHKKGVSVVGDNAERFMKSKKSSELCDEKIQSYIDTLMDKLEGYNEDEIISRITLLGIDSSLWLRGHFLFSVLFKCVVTALNQSGKKVSMSAEAFYTSLITAFEMTFNNTQPDFEYYTREIGKISA